MDKFELITCTENERPRIIVKDMAFHMQPLSPREWVIEGLLAVGNVGLLSAWTGSGKTWIADDIAITLALGQECMGFKTAQGTCLIINEEMDEYDLSLRLAMCNRAHFGDEDTPVKTISFARFNLFSEKTATEDALLLETQIIAANAKLVIIDSLSDIMQGGDENAVKDTQPVFMKLSDIAKNTKSAILVIHHTGKNGSTRGSSAIPGAVDLAIIAKRTADSPYINFETEKARIIPSIKWSVKMVWTENQFYTERIDHRKNENDSDNLSDKEKAIIGYLESCNPPQATTKQITSETGVSRYLVMNLEDKGKIRRIDGGGSGTTAIYAVNLLPVKPVENLLNQQVGCL